MHRWIEKGNMVHIHDTTLSSLKKGENSSVCNYMNEHRGHHTKQISQAQKDNA